MTVINGIEIDNIIYNQNEIKSAIVNNELIEDKLHVIAVISNPCLYARRYILFKEFVKRFEEEESNVELYIVELAYDNQRFMITHRDNKKHLQLRTSTPLWHKENMINLGVQKLLPTTWKAFAWIDADIEFESVTWATDTLRVLNGSKDIVQLFSHAIDMNRDETTIRIVHSFGYNKSKEKKINMNGSSKDYSHPGYAWAMTRKAYEKMGGLYDKGILGSGDCVLATSLVNIADKVFKVSRYDDLLEFQKKAKTLRLGYIPTVIRHHFHGSKENRRYNERWKLLDKYKYDTSFVEYDQTNGLLIPSVKFPKEFKKDILQYFFDRKEDD